MRTRYHCFMIGLVIGSFLTEGCGTMGRGAIQQAWTVEDRCRVLFNWAGRFEQEFPSAFFIYRGTKQFKVQGGFQSKVLNLYRDEYFVPVFGTPFDEFTQEQRTKFYRTYVPPCQHKGYPEARTYAELFGVGLTGGAVETVVRSVISDRLRAQWKERVLADVKSLPPSEESYAKLEEWAKEGMRDLADFWPSEQKTFFNALDVERKRVGEAALVARIDRLVSGPPAYQNLLALEKLINGNQGLFAAVSPETAKVQQQRGEKALYAGLKALLNDERASFDSRGEGLMALEYGTAWFIEFAKRYLEKFQENPPIQDMETYAKTHRARDIELAQGLLKTAISHAQTEQEINTVLERYLGLDIDLPQRQKLQAVVAARTNSLKFEKERWKYSARELGLMARPPEVSVPDRYDAPTVEELRLAILRAYVENGAEWVDKNTVKMGLSPASNMWKFPITVSTIELLGCSSFTLEGYHCRYRPSIRVDLVERGTGQGSKATPGDFLTALFEGMQRLKKPEVNEEQFMLTSTGWRSASLEEKVQLRMLPWEIFLGGKRF